jgi:prepilin-type N-terminal cleavage/methylation domain-containing protein
MSQLHKYTKAKKQSKGFTLIEVVVAIAVLTVGVIGMAFMMSGIAVLGSVSTASNTANVLASEKLDSLNKFPQNSLDVAPGGSLTGGPTCAAGDIYCDTVTVNETTGADYETQTQVNTDGTTQTTTIVHAATGCVDTPANCGVPAAPAGAATFTRRWLITLNPVITSTGGATSTVTGYRRVTVIVTQNNASDQHPVTFQMSMVRP